MKYNIEQILELAKEVHADSSQWDWDELMLDKDTTFETVANEIVEMVNSVPNAAEREIMLISSIIAISVDNLLKYTQTASTDHTHMTKH